MLCAAGIYLVIGALQTDKNYDEAIEKLDRHDRQLDRAKRRIDRYMQFVDNNPFYEHNPGEPQWEKIDETWGELGYEELLHRLEGLYRQDRPFVLDYFSASLGTTDESSQNQDSAPDSPKQTGDIDEEESELVFHLQGYFLCPCL